MNHTYIKRQVSEKNVTIGVLKMVKGGFDNDLYNSLASE